jgi:L-ectoine synthase
MKIVKTKELEKTNRDVLFTGGNSIRLLIESDNMGFGVCKTHIPKNENAHHWHYKNHLEACYCISGSGILTNLESGERFEIKPDVMYVLDKNDDHTFKANTDVVLISIFNPPLKGNETHDSNGNYII